MKFARASFYVYISMTVCCFGTYRCERHRARRDSRNSECREAAGGFHCRLIRAFAASGVEKNSEKRKREAQKCRVSGIYGEILSRIKQHGGTGKRGEKTGEKTVFFFRMQIGEGIMQSGVCCSYAVCLYGRILT